MAGLIRKLALPLLAFGVLSGTAYAATAPKNTSPPTIVTASGIQPSPGQTLIASAGTWSGTPAPAFTYEWIECDYTGSHCLDTEHSGNSYAIGNADYAHDLEVVVTGTNSAGHVSVTSAPVYVGPMPPQLLSPPTISGGTQVGDTLTATPGVWLTYPAYQATYVWWDCDSSGTDCTVSSTGGSGPSYTLTPADVGFQVQVTVYVDDGDQASAQSAPTAAVTTAPPPPPPGSGSGSGSGANGGSGSTGGTTPGGTPVTPAVVVIPHVISAPRISGRARVGRKLTATPGRWSASPTSYRYTWWDCRSNRSCRQIKHASGSTYSVRAADTAYKIAVQVTAGNSAGNSAPARSAATAAVPGRRKAAHDRRAAPRGQA